MPRRRLLEIGRFGMKQRFLKRAIHLRENQHHLHSVPWYQWVGEAGSAPGEQKANLVCSSKGY